MTYVAFHRLAICIQNNAIDFILLFTKLASENQKQFSSLFIHLDVTFCFLFGCPWIQCCIFCGNQLCQYLSREWLVIPMVLHMFIFVLFTYHQVKDISNRSESFKTIPSFNPFQNYTYLYHLGKIKFSQRLRFRFVHNHENEKLYQHQILDIL